MIDYKKHKSNFSPYLEKLYQSDKPMIIYRYKEGYKILEAYYQPGEFNEGRQKMIWMPENVDLILNPTSGAPGFSVENVFCLPGVPSIMKSMLGGLKNKIVWTEFSKIFNFSEGFEVFRPQNRILRRKISQGTAPYV